MFMVLQSDSVDHTVQSLTGLQEGLMSILTAVGVAVIVGEYLMYDVLIGVMTIIITSSVFKAGL